MKRDKPPYLRDYELKRLGRNASLGLVVLERAGLFFGVGARFFGAGSGATMAKISRSAASQ